MVRAYILTKHEKEILSRFLETGDKLNGFAVLIHYLKRTKNQLTEDLELIEKVLEKVSET